MKAPRSHGVRFAPSPTGRFHIGNLRTAWISFEWSRRLNLPWVVRFEDIDQPRVLAGARETQLADMSALDLKPDLILTQTDFRERHWSLLKAAIASGQVYPCDCSRKDVAQALAGLASAPHDGGNGPVYSGHCRDLSPCRNFEAPESIAWRFRMNTPAGTDDFIIARSSVTLDDQGFPSERSFVPAYHWACAIDDFDGGYELLVRGVDLESAAPLQGAIFDWLRSLEGGEPRPAIFHASLVVQNDGHRLEKRTQGVTLPELAARGLAPADVLRILKRSFEKNLWSLPVTDGALLREPQAQIRLIDLGI